MPELDPIEARKPTRQSLIEMAAYLKGELKKKTGNFSYIHVKYIRVIFI